MAGSEIGRAVSDAATLHWGEFHPAAALCCLPAMVLILTTGLLIDYRSSALAATTGALVAGYGFFQRVTNRRGSVMLLVTAGMAVSAAVGTVANVNLMLETTCVGVWGFALGVATIVSPPLSWMVLQWSIALVVAAAMPADLPQAGYRALLVSAGGIVQTIVVLAIVAIVPSFVPDVAGDAASTLRARSLLKSVRSVLARRVPGIGFGVIVAVAAACGTIAFHVLGLPNGYWVPMTILLILRPASSETESRAFARIAGTILGACSVTLLAAWLRPSEAVLTGLIALASWGCFSMQRVNYAVLSVCITAYVALLFAYAGLPEPAVALHRTVATGAGGVIALFVHLAAKRLPVRQLLRGNSL